MYPSKPLKPQAQKLFDQIRPKISQELSHVSEIPVSVLLWGPYPDDTHEVGRLRIDLRNELREEGHLAMFGEEIVDFKLTASLRVQQLVHAGQFDVVVSLPSTPGAIGELHDFAHDWRVNTKLLVCLNKQLMDGYSNQSISAVCSVLTFEAIYYDGYAELPIIKSEILNHIQRIREIKYIFKGRI
ncbi:hypothetical protein [Mucilaginibacter sp. OK283]|jgi:hypothetical protein|uniref:hypothetical protein n=1 Tax=Mucilaginibacter sp. OK283 TaxID=1881049 RepID=UPI0008C85693|nr:hypothetical protein [Mucilaginibacter sp. OK283]SEO20354.1 hypothetical protein SAMN05428947_101694 [Mucilaginibacter sp. OK283]